MAVQMLGIKTKFTDDQGRPLVGGKVHAYFAGTTTYQDTFKDPDMTIVNTNPIILDDSGSADVYLNGSYRIRVFDKNDVLIEEQDGVTQSASGEITTAKGEIIGLYGAVLNSLTNEVKRAVAAEKTIADSLTSETTRAKSAESALQSSIDAEAVRAKKAESDLSTSITKEVNDRKTEVTRLDEADAVLQAQINSVGGGKLAYKTYAEMVADKSNIAAKSSIDIIADSDDKNGTYLYDGANFVKSQYDLEKLIRSKVQNTFGAYAQMVASNLSDGAYALVADDIGAKNGVYIKENGAWVKSKYDPTGFAKEYVDSKIGLDDSEALVALKDSRGKIATYIDSSGELYLTGLADSVQRSIYNLGKKSENLTQDENRNILTLVDKNGLAAATLDDNGLLTVNKLEASNQVEHKDLDAYALLNTQVINNVATQANAIAYRSADRVLAIQEPSAVNAEYLVGDRAEFGANQLSTGFMVRIEKNKFLLAQHPAIGNGDFAHSWGVMRELIVNPDYSVTVGEPWVIFQDGTDQYGEYGIGITTIVRLTVGDHKGRLVAGVLKIYSATNKHDTFISYSDDNGRTWSTLKPFKDFIPLYDSWGLSIGSPGKGIQIRHGKYKGRIVMPCWHASENYPISYVSRGFWIYSDDDGITWHLGAETPMTSISETGVVEVENGNLMMLLRDDSNVRKLQMFSYDGGQTLTDLRVLDETTIPDVAVGLINTDNDFDLSTPKLIMTSPVKGRRDKGAIYLSYDFKHFDLQAMIVTNRWVAYTDIEPIDEHHIIVQYEDDARHKGYVRIINLKHIFNGEM